MLKTKIEWCDTTWNPVTGCRHGCEYCYARKIAERFGGASHTDYLNCYSITMPNGKNHVLEKPIVDIDRDRKAPYPFDFDPTFHKYKLDELVNKKGRTVFVCSMADLFGEWVPDAWILEIFEACRRAPQHTYLFLTKNPARYLELAERGLLPQDKNMWYGSTATTPDVPVFFSQGVNTFMSVEPILTDFGEGNTPVDWVIIGAETGRQAGKVVPEKSWIDNICQKADVAGVPVYMKDSLLSIMGEENMRREFPWHIKPTK